MDSSGAAIQGARVEVVEKATGFRRTAFSGVDGKVQFKGSASRAVEVRVFATGFTPEIRSFERFDSNSAIEIRLPPATLAQEVKVTASRVAGLPESMERLPGSLAVIDPATLTESRPMSVGEALRKVSGLHVRAEEGFDLRPNIGIRGLNPTRSQQVLLLEDGSPLAYAPYGDNSSYYHPPIERFDTVEVVKGGGQILYGPRTVGGVVNYVTPAPPDRRTGSLNLMGGERDFWSGHLRYGDKVGNTALLFDLLRKQGEGARENMRIGMHDFNVKSLTPLGASQTLGLRFNFYEEDSNLPYSGLRESEWAANPRFNPFRNDYFNVQRYGTSVNHVWAAAPNFVVNTAAYGTVFNRYWWRQSSNSNQRPNDAADPACGGMENLFTTCGNEGRLREYYTWGVEPKAKAMTSLFGVRSELDFGFRAHVENQNRIQENGPTPFGRRGTRVENNNRQAQAYSGFVQNRFLFGKLTLAPGVRFESISFERTNRLGAAGQPIVGQTDLNVWIPGIGASWQLNNSLSVFTGLHRGFAPPRVEDVISNSTGQAIELNAEESWNYEAGIRGRFSRNLSLEGTFFRMDFANQLVAASVAGGVGATLTNGGETMHQGGELSGEYTWDSLGGSGQSLTLRSAYTWIPVARYEGLRFSNIGGFGAVPITGNRLPYAPEHAVTSSVSYHHPRGLHAFVESVYVGGQFGDDLNIRGGTPDGQRGAIPSQMYWNATVSYPVEQWRTTFFTSVKNVFDRLYMVDRSRGIIPGMPRVAQVGMEVRF
ncbi:MAG: TonB-dependent receptor [Bryobacterales bacterium]|nr:TonB-dependent receptor [Bryobacterales bacterium]